MTRTSRRRALALGAALGLALAGCAGGDVPPPSPGPGGAGLEKTFLRVGARAVPETVALHIAIARGFFAQEGLTVEPVELTGAATALPQLEIGLLDVTQTTYVSALLAVRRGKAIKLVADMYRAAPGAFPIMVPKDSPIRTVADLKNKVILVNNHRSVATLAVTAQLRAAGLSERDVAFVAKPTSETGEAIHAGEADAGWVTEPFVTASRGALGFRTLADSMAGPTADLPVAGWMATGEWVRRHPRTLAAFQRAISRAQQLAASDRDEIEAVLPAYTMIDAELAPRIALGLYPSRLEAARLQRVADLMLEYRYLPGPIDVTSIIATTPDL